jgi:hypothetical protein
MLALAMLVWFGSSLGARPARAAGCHVPDRPVLGVNSTGQDDPHIAAWALQDRGAVAPPALTRLPCPDQTPHAPMTSTVPMDASGLATVMTVPAVRYLSFGAVDADEIPDPHPFRLDRPPR